LLLTALSIALGVTLIAGTYVFTDTINASFEGIFGNAYEKTDVAITADTDLSGGGDPPPVPGALLDKVKAVPGVAVAEGSVFRSGLIARRADGSKLKGVGFNAITSVSSKEFSTTDYVAGEAPRTADEVSIIKSTADNEGLEPGDKLLLSAAAPAKEYVISGVYTFSGVDSFGGGVIGTFTLPEAQRLSGIGDDFSEIDIIGEDGVTATALRGRVADAVRGTPGLNVRTGSQEASAQLDSINSDFLGTLRTALLAFGGIALFVGAFLIFNTFSITVAQRTREFALLRVLGAKRGQILRSVLFEGVTLGVIGSLIGLGLGVLTARGLRAVFKAIGADMPNTGTVISARTIIVSIVVGLTITVIASIAPALRATRVPPLAALREGFDRERGPSRWGFILGAVLTALGLVAMAYGLFGGLDATPALSWLGLGAAMTFLGVAFLSPRLVGPLAGLIGVPLSRRGVTGVLARQNTVRQPGRTAVTAAALMIGVALVTFASIFAAGIGATIRDAVASSFTGQAVIQSDSGGGPPTPIPAAATKAVGEVTGVNPDTFGQVYKLDWKDGSAATLAGLGQGEVLVGKDYAEAHNLSIGDELVLQTQRVKKLPMKIVGITDDDAGVVGDVSVSLPVIAQQFGASNDAVVMAAFDVPKDQEASVRAAINSKLNSDFSGLKVQSNDEFVKDQEQQVNQLLVLIYALLTMAIIVSLFGIVNTLVLSIAERVRELGLLRAIGMTSRQVRQMIRYEAVITALIGAVLGMVLGIVLAVLVTRAIDTFVLTIPIGTMIFLLIASAIAGVLAAILPARRAAKLNVLEALAYE
jgi:putative ABC transport system permease protein